MCCRVARRSSAKLAEIPSALRNVAAGSEVGTGDDEVGVEITKRRGQCCCGHAGVCTGQAIILDVDGGVAAHGECFLQRITDIAWCHGHHDDFCRLVTVFIGESYFEGTLIDFINDIVTAHAVNPACGGVELALAPGVGHLLHQNDDFHYCFPLTE